MPSNVEIKARVADVERLKLAARELSGADPVLIRQEDIFFNVPSGRLKLRKLQDQKSQLIFYERSDQTGPKFSDYCISQTDEPESLQATLVRALGMKGVVQKERLLYMVGQTRVHLDNVQDLGDFMELEVVMQEGQSMEEGEQIAARLMEQLGVARDQLISGAYMDLILNKQTKTYAFLFSLCI
ncbi:uncharacterized protein LOC128231012 [Mya arenaria]|uniref:uncharacterized protein LOC128231012 n=1 Tax=Mya arenaria TaxID=6604 RepID=UPI0022E08423|nr:uncharacterized protein LOC128231012 [Mya arenaria]